MNDVWKRALIFGALIAWCGALLALRVHRTHTYEYAFLVWNLFLATTPAIAAVLFVVSRSVISRVIWFILWLLFLPNAPYIVTDFVHLGPHPNVPLWFDIAMFLSFAGTGLLLGYSSLADVQGVVSQRYGAIASWFFAAAVLLLSGFGIYLGRSLRWNSWDVVEDPIDISWYIAGGAVHPLEHRRTIAVTLIYGIGLILGYLAYQLPRLRMNMQSP
ncbi:MAG TPA: DUF1361 domain-containing protein [Thermoanaerobaculia bacterium]